MTTRVLSSRRRAPLILTLAVAMVIGLMGGPPAQAQPQSPGGPIVLTQGASQDVITYLTAGAAEMRGPFTWARGTDNTPKYLWLQNWSTTDQYLRWRVSAAQAAEYQLTSMLAATAGDRFQVFLDDKPALEFTVRQNSWRREVVGNLTIPAGEHTLTIMRLTVGQPAKVKAFELLPIADLPGYQARAAAFNKAGATWRDQKWGVMFQMGQWSYPPAGDKLPIDQAAAAFDVPKFVELVKSLHADYVIWSVTWWSYEIWAPISSVDRIVGNGNRTAQRDLIGEIAAALKQEGINFYLYYHTGQDTHTGYGKTDWWQAQQFPDTFAKTGTGDRSTFFNNWESVITEMGQRWGANLDGWFFDDGLIYYPAPYERLGAAARAGNPNRTVSWNNWYSSVYTDFTDVSFGEVCRYTSAPTGGDGRYPGGAEEGVLSQCMFHVNQDWGIFAKNQKIRPPGRTVAKYTSEVRNRSARNLPFSANLMMYSDGSVEPTTLAWLRGVSRSVVADRRCAWGCTRLDAKDSQVPLGDWSLVPGGNKGDDNDDLMSTTSDRAHLSQNFSGTGIRIVGPKSANGAVFRVAIDGQMVARVSTKGPASAQEVLWEVNDLPRGNHNVTIYKGSRGTLAVDYLEATSSAYSLNNSAAQVQYQGQWTTAWQSGNYQGDVAQATANGASAKLAFNGTGIQLLAPRSPDGGDVEVMVDGTSYGLWSSRAPRDAMLKPLFEVKGLTPGPHEITITKRSGGLVQLDQFNVQYGNAATVNDTDPAIQLVGPWSRARTGPADYQGDLSYTSQNGASATLAFTGTGVRIYGVQTAEGATVAVTVDGVPRGTWTQGSSGQRQAQVPFFEVGGLDPGPHQVTVTKVSGGSLNIDLFETWSAG